MQEAASRQRRASLNVFEEETEHESQGKRRKKQTCMQGQMEVQYEKL